MGTVSRNKLGIVIEGEVTKMFETILDYAHVACTHKDTYNALRSKILRAGNNCIRSLKKELERYDVETNRISEEVIEVANKAVSG